MAVLQVKAEPCQVMDGARCDTVMGMETNEVTHDAKKPTALQSQSLHRSTSLPVVNQLAARKRNVLAETTSEASFILLRKLPDACS